MIHGEEISVKKIFCYFLIAIGLLLPAGCGTDEPEAYDRIPMVMVDGKIYYDTGKVSGIKIHSEEMDGEITSTVESSEIPTENDQSNFGAGYGYQYAADDTIEVCVDDKWVIYECRSGDGDRVRFGDDWYWEADLSEETLDWLAWYNSLSEEDQRAIDFVPADLLELAEIGGQQDMPAEEEK